MQIRILGHVEAAVDDRLIELGGVKQRAVLAMLGLEANRVVSADRLIEGLWGEEPPRSAAKMVQNYVWRLRKVLADDTGAEIRTHGRGYELRVDREHVDVWRLEQLLAEAARAAAAGRPNGTAREALALFRGEPLTDVAHEPFASAEIRRLEELRCQAAELAIEADLAAGFHHEVLGEVDGLLRENPLRERLHAQRILALYRCGRQAEALDAYREARQTLVEQIGVEPTPELRRLHDAVLRQDAALEVVPAAAELPPELDLTTAPPLAGRAGELRRLRACWQGAVSGTGSLVTIVGPYGMGKTRLAMEIAADAHRDEATVLYAGGTGTPEAAFAAIARARGCRRPALLVLDDMDRAPVAVRVALRDLAAALGGTPVLVVATGQEAAALSRLEPQASVTLAPLDEEAVGSIAGLYAPAGGHDAVPVAELLARSRGVARHVHEAAGEWARREATRRVDRIAGRAAAGRHEAQALEAELAGSVGELQSTRERAGRVAGDGVDCAPAGCPYKGLAAYAAGDAAVFFGRERLVAELAARLVGAPLLALVGPSGCGKSSVLRAGLLPALAGGVLPASENWVHGVIRPGEHPLRELRRAQRKLAREWRSVLAVDQFEELFTACRDESERRGFVDALVHAAADRHSRTVVVLAVRAEFYGRCAAYPELSRLVGANTVLVGPMARDELARAIERPAHRVGLTVEPELLDALLADVDGEPGALPLLSTALVELWRQHDGRRLRVAAYARSGGVHGAVARLAEDAFVELDRPRQAAARTLLLRLAGEGENGEVVRRRIALAELEADRGAAAADVIARLTDRRLLTVGDGAVEVAHEALLREWPRLRGWLEDDVQGRRLHRAIGSAARAWDADGRDPEELYRGPRLASALHWATDHEGDLNAVERAFLTESRTASERAQRRLRTMLAGAVALLVLAIAAGAAALDQRGEARAQATAADAQRLGAQALAEDDLDRALLLARQGVSLHDSVQTRASLLSALLRSPAAIGVMRVAAGRLTGLDLSPDGRVLALADDGSGLHFVDARRRRAAGPPQTIAGLGGSPGPLGRDSVRFSADGSRLAVAGSPPVILDARTRRVLSVLQTFEGQGVYRLGFTPDGRTLMAAVANPPDLDTTIERYHVRSGRRVGAPRPVGRRSPLASLHVTQDGHRLMASSAGGSTTIFDARTLHPVRRLPFGAKETALSRDGRTLLLGGADGAVRFLDLVSGAVRTASGRHGGAVVAATFSADGRSAVTAGEDRRLIVWDVDQAAAGETLEGHAGQITGLAISPDGETLYTAAQDGRVVIWDLAGARRLGRPFEIGPNSAPVHPPPGGAGRELVGYAVSPDGRTLAVGHADGEVALTDTRTLRRLRVLRTVGDGPVRSLAYTPDGRALVIGGDEGHLTLVDARRGGRVKRLPGHKGTVLVPSFSADGRLMATASTRSEILLWPLRGPTVAGRPRRYHPSLLFSDASLSPDGRRLAVTSALGVEIVDVATLRRLASLPDTDAIELFARFTPDGRHLVTGSREGSAQLWSARTGRPATRALGGHTGEVLWQSTSPDGRTLATGSTDGTIRLFDLRTQKPLGAPLPAVPNRAVAPQFTPDGAYLLALTNTGRAYRWDVRPSSWARHACAVTGRALTRAEWDDALPGRDYAPACVAPGRRSGGSG